MNLSVIIPTKNRSQLLSKVLQSIRNQTLSQNQFEVIIIDNGSIDNTKEICNEFADYIKNLRYFYDETPGLHIGRHIGMKEAKTDILVYFDDDVQLFPNHLENVLESFKNDEIVLVGGKNLPDFESIPPNWLQEMWQDKQILGQLSVLDLGNKKQIINANYVWGCNFSIKKSILYKAGGFHPDSMPQDLIEYRGDGETSVSNYIKNNGYKALYNPQTSVYHYVPNNRMTEEYFCKRMFNQGVSDSYSKLRKYKSFSNLENRKDKKVKNAILLKDKMHNSYLDGYIYHQKRCKQNILLYQWVLKERYYD